MGNPIGVYCHQAALETLKRVLDGANLKPTRISHTNMNHLQVASGNAHFT